jgi:hypothetical protein
MTAELDGNADIRREFWFHETGALSAAAGADSFA